MSEQPTIRMYRVHLDDEECPNLCFEVGQEAQIADMLAGAISEFLAVAEPGAKMGVEVELWTQERHAAWAAEPVT